MSSIDFKSFIIILYCKLFILLNTDVFINMDQNIQKYYELRSYLCCLLTGMVGFSGLIELVDDIGSPTLCIETI